MDIDSRITQLPDVPITKSPNYPITKFKTLVSWSSGKDSAWMVHVLRGMPEIDLVGILTTINEAAGRVAMHAVREELLEAQAEALGLPLVKIFIPSPCPNDVYERAMAGAVARAVSDGVTHMAFGDLFLEDIRRYREERLAGTGVTPLFPLFGANTSQLAREMIAAGLGARLTCVDPRVLDRTLRRPRVRFSAPGRTALDRRPVRRARRIPQLCISRPDVPAPNPDRDRRYRRTRWLRLHRSDQSYHLNSDA